MAKPQAEVDLLPGGKMFPGDDVLDDLDGHEMVNGAGGTFCPYEKEKRGAAGSKPDWRS